MKQDDPKVPLDPAGAAVDLADTAWIDGMTIRNLAQALLLAAEMIGVPATEAGTMTAETIVGTQRTFMCGATRTARYRHVRRADLICSRCGRSQRHERVTDGPSSDPREQVNAEMSAEAAAILEEIRYLQNIADRLSIEVSGRWHENDAEFLSTVECVDWAGNRRWEARIHPDATLKGQLRAFQAIVDQQTMWYDPQAMDPIWYGDMLVLDLGPSCPAWCQEHSGGGDRADDGGPIRITTISLGPLCHWRTVTYGDARIMVFQQEDPQPHIEPQGAAVNMGEWDWLDGATIRNLAQALLDAADMIGVPVEAER